MICYKINWNFECDSCGSEGQSSGVEIYISRDNQKLIDLKINNLSCEMSNQVLLQYEELWYLNGE